jgi:hypothetical protein
MNNPWQPVQIETKDVIALSEGTVHLIFDLSAVADADWSHLFLNLAGEEDRIFNLCL